MARNRTPRFEFTINSPPVNDWACQIGKLMINYSALEAQIDRFVIHLSERAYTDADVTRERSRGFHQKHKEVAKLARRRSPSDEWLAKVMERLERAKWITAVRDQVAHSALYLLVEESRNRRGPVSRIPPTPRQRQKGQDTELDLEVLKKAVDDAVKVVPELSNLLEQWRNASKVRNVPLDLSTLTFIQRVKRAGVYWWLHIRDAGRSGH